MVWIGPHSPPWCLLHQEIDTTLLPINPPHEYTTRVIGMPCLGTTGEPSTMTYTGLIEANDEAPIVEQVSS